MKGNGEGFGFKASVGYSTFLTKRRNYFFFNFTHICTHAVIYFSNMFYNRLMFCIIFQMSGPRDYCSLVKESVVIACLGCSASHPPSGLSLEEALPICRQVKGAFYCMISWKYKLFQGRIRFVFYCGYPLIKTQLFADVLQRYHSFPRTMLESRG